MAKLEQKRLELDAILRETLGSTNVYYDPPSSVKMKYPAIRYSRNKIRNIPADNTAYLQSLSYEVIIIDDDPDSEIIEKVSQLPMCVFDRSYMADNLHHSVFTLNY